MLHQAVNPHIVDRSLDYPPDLTRGFFTSLYVSSTINSRFILPPVYLLAFTISYTSHVILSLYPLKYSTSYYVGNEHWDAKIE